MNINQYIGGQTYSQHQSAYYRNMTCMPIISLDLDDVQLDIIEAYLKQPYMGIVSPNFSKPIVI